MTEAHDSQWFLTEVKDGVEIAQHRLNRPVTVVGRSENADIILAHESCSRSHASIRLSPLSVRDSSTHGTFVDKTRVKDSLSLRAGNVIQFGASTRLYFVEELVFLPKAPAAIDISSPPDAVTPAASRTDKQLDLDKHEASPDADAADRPLSLDVFFRDETKIPEQFYKEWERYKANTIKLENIRLESERIHVKGELTDGQQRQLERNREREDQLLLIIGEAEETLLKKLFPDKPLDVAAKEALAFDDDEEEVDDRTDKVDNQECSDAETEASLTTKFKYLVGQLEALDRDMTAAKQHQLQINERLLHLKEKGDDEEAFYVQNDLDLALESISKLDNCRRSLDASLHDTSRLLKLANPKLTVDPVTGFVGTKFLPLLATKSGVVTSDWKMMPPPPARKAQKTECMLPPPPKRACHVQATSPLIDMTVLPGKDPPGQATAALSPPSSRTIKPSTRKGTAAMFLGSGRSPADNPQSTETAGIALVSDVRQDAWRAPKDQDGSGRTKLNQKFAGRY